MDGILGRTLSDEERDRLASWQRSDRRAKYVRARVVLLAEQTPNAAVVARAVGVHVQTVRDLVRTFRAEGLAGVEPKVQAGPPIRFGGTAEESLIAILHEQPEKHGFDESRWTLETAAAALAKVLGVPSISHETVRQLLKRRRHSWTRAKEWLVSPDPEYLFRKDGASG
jgi:transposase